MKVTMKQKKYNVSLTVQCASCKKTREIVSGEIDNDDFPLCDVCYMPMMPKQAKARLRKNDSCG